MSKSWQQLNDNGRLIPHPVVPFGAGSSVEGNFVAPFSGISIDFSKMDKIVAFFEDEYVERWAQSLEIY